MSTIEELMEGKRPGDVQVRLSSWLTHEYFIPHFASGREDAGGIWWVGRYKKEACPPTLGMFSTIAIHRIGWELYSAPKKTVIVYEWMYKSSDGWRISEVLRTEEVADEWYRGSLHKKTGRQFEVEIE